MHQVEGGGDEEAEGTEEPFEVPCSVLLVHHLECVNIKRQLFPQTLPSLVYLKNCWLFSLFCGFKKGSIY